MDDHNEPEAPADVEGAGPGQKKKREKQQPREIGGPEGPEPTRYGDWERNGRVSDF